MVGIGAYAPGFTFAGDRLSEVVPSPIAPKTFHPQHLALPLWTAQVWLDLAEMLVTPEVSPATCVGTFKLAVPPWLNQLEVQHPEKLAEIEVHAGMGPVTPSFLLTSSHRVFLLSSVPGMG